VKEYDFFETMLAKFPSYDPNWPAPVSDKWWEAFNKLWDMANELDKTTELERRKGLI
jgi:hypothetical protein